MKKFIITAIAFGVAISSSLPASAIYNVAPKVGQCFMHTNGDVSADSPLKNPISCSQKHTAEIYYVGKWPLATQASQMVFSDALKIAASICGTPAMNRKLQSAKINYWAWFTPSESAWAAGQRWIRCDGMVIATGGGTNDLAQYVFASWSGKRIK